VRYDDPDLGIAWPLAPAEMSPRDTAAGSWTDLVGRGDWRP
jgi:dTDP-4-dehydrorhamnose 3,5-epimerase